MNTNKTATLADDLTGLAEQLQQDLVRETVRKPIFENIREMRQRLNALELELRDYEFDAVGDAC